jgi:hypothetical protein
MPSARPEAYTFSCEPPLAQKHECHIIIDAARAGRVKLMTAYRLHFRRC